MPKRVHWMKAIANEIHQRMADALDDVAAGVLDSVPFATPPEEAPPTLQAFLQASPQERQSYLMSIPPENYREVTGKLMTMANQRYGGMASVLGPLFDMHEADMISAQLADPVGGQMNSLLGTAAAKADLIDLLGINPFE